MNEVKLKCADCKANLLKFIVSKPYADLDWNIRANCPFCNGSSETLHLQGEICPAGYGVMKPDDPTDDVPSTIYDNFKIDNGEIVFNVLKANPKAKAYYD